MVIPVDEESFNLIKKSSKNIIEFVNGLKEDDKLISAVKSRPNMDSYLDGGEVAPILIAMSAQDIVGIKQQNNSHLTILEYKYLW